MEKECCGNCRYCSYSPREDEHIGKSSDITVGGWAAILMVNAVTTKKGR